MSTPFDISQNDSHSDQAHIPSPIFRVPLSVFRVGLCVAALATLGVVILYSTTFNETDLARFRSQLLWLGLGVAAVPLLVGIDYDWWQRKPVLYTLAALCLAMLVCVFIPGLGVQTNGAFRWLRGLGQPSELAKPVVIVLVAAWCSKLDERGMLNLSHGFIIPCLMGGLPALLIFAEPDWGSAILLGAVTAAMLLTAGARLLYLFIAAVCGSTALVAMLACNPLRLERFMVFLDPKLHRYDAGWQIWQSLLAIGSGGAWGSFLEGSFHRYGFVPEQQTDFIFARIGEETGFMGTTAVVLLYAGILFGGFQIMKRARSRFGQLLAGGCTTVIVLQACINMAVATSIVPNKGLPLPFVSYGGSSLLAMFICVGLLGSVAIHRNPAAVARASVSSKETSR